MIKTCSFDNYIGSRGISIAISSPKWWIGEVYSDLAPPVWLWRGYKAGIIGEAEYKEVYHQLVLSKLNPYKVLSDLEGKTMLCHCKYFCHRHLAAEWLMNQTGVKVIESIR